MISVLGRKQAPNSCILLVSQINLLQQFEAGRQPIIQQMGTWWPRSHRRSCSSMWPVLRTSGHVSMTVRPLPQSGRSEALTVLGSASPWSLPCHRRADLLGAGAWGRMWAHVRTGLEMTSESFCLQLRDHWRGACVQSHSTMMSAC